MPSVAYSVDILFGLDPVLRARFTMEIVQQHRSMSLQTTAHPMATTSGAAGFSGRLPARSARVQIMPAPFGCTRKAQRMIKVQCAAGTQSSQFCELRPNHILEHPQVCAGSPLEAVVAYPSHNETFLSSTRPFLVMTLDAAGTESAQELLERAAESSGADLGNGGGPVRFDGRAFRRGLNKTGRYVRQPSNDKESLALMEEHGVGYSSTGLIARMRQNGNTWQEGVSHYA